MAFLFCLSSCLPPLYITLHYNPCIIIIIVILPNEIRAPGWIQRVQTRSGDNLWNVNSNGTELSTPEEKAVDHPPENWHHIWGVPSGWRNNCSRSAFAVTPYILPRGMSCHVSNTEPFNREQLRFTSMDEKKNLFGFLPMWCKTGKKNKKKNRTKKRRRHGPCSCTVTSSSSSSCSVLILRQRRDQIRTEILSMPKISLRWLLPDLPFHLTPI